MTSIDNDDIDNGLYTGWSAIISWIINNLLLTSVLIFFGLLYHSSYDHQYNPVHQTNHLAEKPSLLKAISAKHRYNFAASNDGIIINMIVILLTGRKTNKHTGFWPSAQAFSPPDQTSQPSDYQDKVSGSQQAYGYEHHLLSNKTRF
jgi:hypothetical protein